MRTIVMTWLLDADVAVLEPPAHITSATKMLYDNGIQNMRDLVSHSEEEFFSLNRVDAKTGRSIISRLEALRLSLGRIPGGANVCVGLESLSPQELLRQKVGILKISGASLKKLKDLGITTLEQLRRQTTKLEELPMENLEEIRASVRKLWMAWAGFFRF